MAFANLRCPVLKLYFHLPCVNCDIVMLIVELESHHVAIVAGFRACNVGMLRVGCVPKVSQPSRNIKIILDSPRFSSSSVCDVTLQNRGSEREEKVWRGYKTSYCQITAVWYTISRCDYHVAPITFLSCISLVFTIGKHSFVHSSRKFKEDVGASHTLKSIILCDLTYTEWLI